MARAPSPLVRGQGNEPFRVSDARSAAKRGQTVPYDINGAPVGAPSGAGSLNISIIDLPQADVAEPLLRTLISRAVTFSGGIADAGIAASGNPSFSIRKDGVEVGTVAYAGTGGVVSFSDSTFPALSLFELYPPSPADGALDQVSITLII